MRNADPLDVGALKGEDEYPVHQGYRGERMQRLPNGCLARVEQNGKLLL